MALQQGTTVVAKRTVTVASGRTLTVSLTPAPKASIAAAGRLPGRLSVSGPRGARVTLALAVS